MQTVSNCFGAKPSWGACPAILAPNGDVPNVFALDVAVIAPVVAVVRW